MKKQFLFILLFSVLIASCTSLAPVPTPTTADAVATVEKFYKIINNAQTKDDISKSWVLLTSKGQCSDPKGFCALAYFQENWWRWKVNYELYGCSSTHVITKETLIPREDNATPTPPAPRYWEYQLVIVESGMLINDRRFTPSPGDDCVLMIEKNTIP